MQSIEQVNTGIGNIRPAMVPTIVPKSDGFNFLPSGTIRQHDGGKWGLYYHEGGHVSYMVYDQGKQWQITPIFGKVKLTYAKGVAATKPCCQGD